jgi:hypothetical protein
VPLLERVLVHTVKAKFSKRKMELSLKAEIMAVI